MTAALLDGSAEAIATAIKTGAASAREIVQETLEPHRGSQWRARRLHRRDGDARPRQGRRDRRGARARSELGAARGRAVRRQEPVRHRRIADARRLQDQPRSRAGDGRRDVDRASGSGRGSPRRRAQHGRVRLRLHRRERPRRPVPQPARSRAHDRRIVRRIGRRRGRRPRSDRARDPTPTARFACRAPCADCSASSRPMAGCRAPACSRSSPVSIMWARSREASPISRSATTPCSAGTKRTRRRPTSPQRR